VRDLVVPRGPYQAYTVAYAHRMTGAAFLASGGALGTSMNTRIIKAYKKAWKACKELDQSMVANGLRDANAPLPALGNLEMRP